MTDEKHVSYSQFGTFLSCPFKYKLNYIDKIDISTNNEYNTFGSAMHRTIQDFVTNIYNKELNENSHITNTSKLRKYIEDISKENNIDQNAIAALEDFYFNGIYILKDLYKKKNIYFPENWSLVDNEYKLNVELKSGLNLIGYIDTVLYDKENSTYILYDYKTSLWGWKDYKKKDNITRWQLILYKMFFARLMNIPFDRVKIAYVILKQNIYKNAQFPQSRISKFEPPSGTQTINKCFEAFVSFLDNILDENFIYKKTINPKNCKYCPFRGKYCEGV